MLLQYNRIVQSKVIFIGTYRPFGYERVYLPLFKVADTTFLIRGDDMYRIKLITKLLLGMRTGDETFGLKTRHGFLREYVPQAGAISEVLCPYSGKPS